MSEYTAARASSLKLKGGKPLKKKKSKRKHGERESKKEPERLLRHGEPRVRVLHKQRAMRAREAARVGVWERIERESVCVCVCLCVKEKSGEQDENCVASLVSLLRGARDVHGSAIQPLRECVRKRGSVCV